MNTSAALTLAVIGILMIAASANSAATTKAPKVNLMDCVKKLTGGEKKLEKSYEDCLKTAAADTKLNLKDAASLEKHCLGAAGKTSGVATDKLSEAFKCVMGALNGGVDDVFANLAKAGKDIAKNSKDFTDKISKALGGFKIDDLLKNLKPKGN